MAYRLYFIPRIGDGASRATRLRPNYLDAAGVTVRTCIYYGDEPVVFVCADVTAGQHTTLTANADVAALPVDIDQPIGAALPTVQSKLEALNIPAQWITEGMTYRAAVRILIAAFQFLGRHNGLHLERLLQGGVTLQTQFNELPLAARQRLIKTAESFGYDISGLTGTITIRQMLVLVGRAWGEQPIYIGGIIL